MHKDIYTCVCVCVCVCIYTYLNMYTYSLCVCVCVYESFGPFIILSENSPEIKHLNTIEILEAIM